MKSKYGVTAKLVWDGGNDVRIPEELGTPAPSQMLGTVAEKVSELSGRTCYDSLGRGRSSADYHVHILDVGHGSVYEHFNMTVCMEQKPELEVFLNRPGLWVVKDKKTGVLRVTFNPRNIIDWNSWSRAMESDDLIGTAGSVGDILAYHGSRAFPAIVPPRHTGAHAEYDSYSKVVPPHGDEEKWVSMFLMGSRGFSHELVRHGDRTGISQRCLAGETVVTFVNKSGHAYSGSIGFKTRTMKWLYDHMQDPRLRSICKKLKARVLDEKTGLFTSGKLLDVTSSGKKECFAVTLEDGKTLTCTKDHRIWTESGWKTLGEIANPVASDMGVVSWGRENALKVGVNGLRVIGNGFYLDREWMVSRVQEGLSDDKISSLCGASPSTVKRYRIKHGLKKRILGSFSESLVQNKEWLERQYCVLKLKQAEIAAIAKCSVAAVHNWCRKYGIQKAFREINLGNIPWNKGKTYSHKKPYSAEAIERYRKSKLGKKNPQWKGGRHNEARRAFHAWKRHNRDLIFKRDGWCCRMCDRHSSQVPVNSRHMKKRAIEIHHILPLWNRPDLACDPWNMATVCWECQCKKLNGREMKSAEFLQRAIQSPVKYKPSDRKLAHGIRQVKVHYKKIVSIKSAGWIDTYDLVLDGPNHGFVGNGLVVHNSTRYVSEDESPWINHPLIQEYLADGELPTALKGALNSKIGETIQLAKQIYSEVNESLYKWLLARGVDKGTARKQARGAARGYLGNALATELIFSASVGQWKRMLRLRCSAPADAEIRAVFVEVLHELKASRYADSFKNFDLVPSSDGMGSCAIEKV